MSEAHALYQFNFPTTILFGAGARRKLAASLRDRGLLRPLLATDRGLSKLPLLADIRQNLIKEGLKPAIYAEVWGNPVKSQVIAGVKAFQDHQADAVVAIGGGAAMDVAKAIALMAHHPGDLFDYEDGKTDARPIDQDIPFFMTMPTTAGTGSEVGRSTVISDDQTHAKKIIFSPRLLAGLVLADPELTLELPAPVTAATGMDALTHLVESYLAKGFHPICDGIALEGLRLVANSLKRCVEFANRSGDRSAEHLYHRGLMLTAAMMGGVAFQKGLGVTHSCAHALSTVCDLHHGLANGILIPYTMRFNLVSERPRFEVLGETVGVGRKAEDFVTWLASLKKEIGIPATLAQVGVRKDHLDKLVDFATRDGCHQLNPRAVTRSDFEQIFSEAIEGR